MIGELSKISLPGCTLHSIFEVCPPLRAIMINVDNFASSKNSVFGIVFLRKTLKGQYFY